MRVLTASFVGVDELCATPIDEPPATDLVELQLDGALLVELPAALPAALPALGALSLARASRLNSLANIPRAVRRLDLRQCRLGEHDTLVLRPLADLAALQTLSLASNGFVVNLFDYFCLLNFKMNNRLRDDHLDNMPVILFLFFSSFY